MQTISTEHSVLHSLAISLCSTHRRVEAEIIAALQEIDRCKLYKKPGQPSLFSYAVNPSGLSESVSYAFIAVARAAIEIPELNFAIQKQKLSVAKAKRIVSVLTAALTAICEFYLDRMDPVRKAKRATQKNKPAKLRTFSVSPSQRIRDSRLAQSRARQYQFRQLSYGIGVGEGFGAAVGYAAAGWHCLP
jgi:hypothetical protein